MRYCVFVVLLLATHSIVLTMDGQEEQQKTAAKTAQKKKASKRKRDTQEVDSQEPLKANAQEVAIQNLLMMAVACKRIDLVIRALAQGADPNVCTEGDYSPLTLAVSHNNVPMVRSLLMCKAEVNAYDKRENAQTPLQMAAIFAGTSMVETLLQCGASPNFHQKDDFSPLAYAVFKLKEDVAQCLVNKEADVQVATKQLGDGITNEERQLLRRVTLHVKEQKSAK